MSVAPPYSRLHAVELPEADAPLIRDLMLAGVASCTATRRDTDTSPYRVDLETVDSLRRELTTTHRVIAAFDGDIPVGVVRLPIADEDGLLRFERLSQVPGYPPKAACEFLVDRVYEEARNLGLRGITCHVLPRDAELDWLIAKDLVVVGSEQHHFADGDTVHVMRLEGMLEDRGHQVYELWPKDAEELLEVMRAAHAQIHVAGVRPDVLLETVENLRHQLSTSSRAIGVRSDGRMVAAMMVHTGSDGVLMFSRLSVLPSENTMGWARVLFDWLLDEAVRLGAPAVGTLVPADRPRLRKLGEAGGMTVRDRGLRLGLDDEMHEVLYMTRDVPTL